MAKITGIIGWIGTVLVFAAVAARLFTPPWPWWNDQYATYMAWAGLAAVLIYMAGQWRDVADFYQGRGARYGTMSLVSIVVFVAILVAINYLSTRQNKRWDFTANQVYSLSDQTIKVLKELPEPVKFTVYDQPARFDSFRNRLDEFKYHSSKVQAEYVDPDRDPARTKAAEVTAYGTIVVGGETITADQAAMDDLLNKLIALKAESWADAKAKTGLDKPALVVSASYDEGKFERVRFGQVGDNAYAGRDGEAGVVKVDTPAMRGAMLAFDTVVLPPKPSATPTTPDKAGEKK